MHKRHPPFVVLPLRAQLNKKNMKKAFKQLTSPEICRRELRHLTEEPHLAGTENSYKIAQYLYKKYQEYGLAAQIYEYEVYLPYPIEVRVEMTAPTHYLAVGKEEKLGVG